ncbi:MAG: redoxin domain-containing protein [Verrucomicrobiota bacterium]
MGSASGLAVDFADGAARSGVRAPARQVQPADGRLRPRFARRLEVWRGLWLVVLGLAFAVGCHRPKVNEPPPVAADGSSVCDLEGKPVDPFGPAGKAVVLIFVRADCPISNRYAPEIRRLFQEFAGQGVSFWLVHPAGDETPSAIRAHASAYQLDLPTLRDPKHILVAKARVRVTPEAAVFLDRDRLCYWGRIDDRFVALGEARPEATRHELRDALKAIVAGKSMAVTNAPAVGCLIAEF